MPLLNMSTGEARTQAQGVSLLEDLMLEDTGWIYPQPQIPLSIDQSIFSWPGWRTMQEICPTPLQGYDRHCVP